MQNCKISLSEACCVILFFLYGLQKVYFFSNSGMFSFLRERIELCIYVCMVCAIIRKKLSSSQLWTVTLIGILLLYGYLTVGYAVWFRGFLMIVMLKNNDFKKVCKSLFYASVIPLVLGVALYLFEISDSGVTRREITAWGFTTPNTLAMLMVVMWMFWLCSKSYLSGKDYMLTWIFAALGYLMQGSRTFLVVMLMLPFLDMAVRKFMSLRKNGFMKKAACLSQAFFMLLSVVLVKLYSVSVFVQKLNPVFGGRVFLNYYNYKKYGVGLSGKAVNLYNITDKVYNDVFGVYSNVNYSTVDNVYIAVLITMGILETAIFMIGYYILVKKAWENKNSLVVAIAVIFSAYGFTESATQEIYMNFVYLYIMAYDILAGAVGPEINKGRELDGVYRSQSCNTSI